MNKVIAIKPNDQRVLTTAETAQKNNWWITHKVSVVFMKDDSFAEKIDAECTPKIGNLVYGFAGKVYKISSVTPVHICWICGEKGGNRIENKFYCTRHFKELTVTRPIKKTGQIPQRNEPCHCGSGKKYKHCCMANDAHEPRHYFNSKYKQEKISRKKTA